VVWRYLAVAAKHCRYDWLPPNSKIPPFQSSNPGRWRQKKSRCKGSRLPHPTQSAHPSLLFKFLEMPRLNVTFPLIGFVVLLLLSGDVAAFGAGNIPS
jgi:hypothetical protein